MELKYLRTINIKMKTTTILLMLTILGLVTGYGYYHFFGCTSNCTISSNPLNSTLYGGLIGVLLGLSFKKDKQK